MLWLCAEALYEAVVEQVVKFTSVNSIKETNIPSLDLCEEPFFYKFVTRFLHTFQTEIFTADYVHLSLSMRNICMRNNHPCIMN